MNFKHKRKQLVKTSFSRAIQICMLVIFSIQYVGMAQNVEENKRPNLLFIMTDQQQYKAMSLAGNTILETPNLDRLAKGGAFFKNAYTPMAVCGPARSSILTGMIVLNLSMSMFICIFFIILS